MGHDGINLMEIDNMTRIVYNLPYHSPPVALATERLSGNNAKLGTAVAWVEIDEVYYSYRLTMAILCHQPHLAVGIDIGSRIGDVVEQHVTGIWYVRAPGVPYSGVILCLVKHRKVFGFQSPEADKWLVLRYFLHSVIIKKGKHHAITSRSVMTLWVAGSKVPIFQLLTLSSINMSNICP